MGDLIFEVDGKPGPYDELFQQLQTAVREQGKPRVKVRREPIGMYLDLRQLLDDKYSDVKISVGDKCFNAHRAVLAQAPFFRTLLEKDFAGLSVVEVEDVSPSVFQHVLRVIYLGDAQHVHEVEETELLREMLEAADHESSSQSSILKFQLKIPLFPYLFPPFFLAFPHLFAPFFPPFPLQMIIAMPAAAAAASERFGLQSMKAEVTTRLTSLLTNETYRSCQRVLRAVVTSRVPGG